MFVASTKQEIDNVKSTNLFFSNLLIFRDKWILKIVFTAWYNLFIYVGLYYYYLFIHLFCYSCLTYLTFVAHNQDKKETRTKQPFSPDVVRNCVKWLSSSKVTQRIIARKEKEEKT